ncbi:MAG: type III secretion system translocon subunit SctB [Candidatus Methylacidiphilales bacterium]|nr:type III secretion system translocon subunit SctB [Candidatus Methylacidiphilales bacterium]
MPDITSVGGSNPITRSDDGIPLVPLKRSMLGGDNLTVDNPLGAGVTGSGGSDRPPRLTSAGAPNPGQAGEADRQLGAFVSQGGQAVLGDIYSVMVLFHQVAQSQRTSAREARDVARETQYAAIDEQASKIREAAWFSLAAGIVSGLASISAGMTTLSAASTATGELRAGNTVGADIALKTGAAQGQIREGQGQIVSSLLNFFATQASADQKKAEKDEAKAKGIVDNESEFVNNMMDVMRDVRQKLQEVANSQTESLRTIMRA